MKRLNGFPRVWLEWVLTLNSDDCFLWPFGAGGRHGYGNFRDGDRVVSPSSWVCERAHGPKPEGLEVRHLCFKRLCCNRQHVKWDTHAENMLDIPRERAARKS